MATAKSLLTPKELAEAIGASESSLRRWVDGGDIRMSRTAGGHRRIPLAEAVRFVRAIGATVVRPDVLGLGDLGRSRPELVGLSDDDKLFESLRTGDADAARGMVVSWYLEGRRLPELFDGPLRSALGRLGELWKHEERGILVEHRATGICLDAIASLRSLLPGVDEGAPLALGGAPQGDPYQIPSAMAAAVLAEAGFRDVNFGAGTPVELLAAEAVGQDAKLVWLSLSAPPDVKAVRPAVRKLAAVLNKHQVPLVLGGRHQAECFPRAAANAKAVTSMAELSAFAQTIRRPPA
jgi:excisionase family DNA binding protein